MQWRFSFFLICMIKPLLGLQSNKTACPDWCSEELEPHQNVTNYPFPLEVSNLTEVCDSPSPGNLTISWSPPFQHSEVVTGYRLFWYTDTLYCECFDKNKRSFVFINGTGGWAYSGSLTYMVKPLPRPNPDEAFVLRPVHCLENNEVSGRPEHEGSSESKYLVVSIGIAIGVVVCIIFYAVWIRVHGKKAIPLEEDLIDLPNLQNPLLPRDNSVYISYYACNRTFTDEVHEMSCWLIEQGVPVVMDRMYTCEIAEIGVMDWSEINMADAKKILVICSKDFLEMCKLRELIQIHRGAARRNLNSEQLKTLNEINFIKREMFLSGHCSDRFVVVLFGVKEDTLPRWLREFKIFPWSEGKDEIVMLVKNEEKHEGIEF